MTGSDEPSRISIGRVRPFAGRPGSFRLEWTIRVGEVKYGKTASLNDERGLNRFRDALLDAAEGGQPFCPNDGCPPGVSRPQQRNAAAAVPGPASAVPLMMDVAARLHQRWLPTAGRVGREGHTARSDVDALCAIGEALLRPNAPALTTKMCKGLRRYMRDLLTPPQNRARLLSLRDDKDAAKSAEFAASSKTAQQRSQRRKNDRIREQRRAAAVAEMLDWEQFYAQHGLTWNELDTAAVQRVLTRLRLTGTGERGQHNTVARRSSAFNEHLNWAVRRGYITTNPSLLLEPEDRNPISVRATAPDLRLIVNLTVGFRLIAAAERLKLAPVGGAGSASGYAVVVALMLLAGLRPAEVRGLRRQNLVNLPESGWGMIVLEFGQSSPGQRYTPDGAVDQQVALKHAGERKTRPVPVPPTLVKLLRALLAAQDLAPDAWLFTAADSKPIPDRHLYEYWNLAKAEVFTDPADRLLLQNMRPYDLRHARASHLLAVGQHLPEAVIASWLGHTVETLRNTYQGVVNVGNEHWEQERTQYLEDLVPEQYRRSPDGSAKSDTDIDDRSLALLQAFQNLGEMEQRMLSDMMKALAKG